MDISTIWEGLAQPGGTILYIVLDGASGLRDPKVGRTAFEAARTPNLDAMARESSCGLLEIVGPGITPGSGPGHLALFGYDPLRFTVGRGVLSALGIGFPLQEGDVAARVNFATVDGAGRITDRRAGRIASELNARLCARIREEVRLDFDGEYFLHTESGHRAVLVLRAPGLEAALADTDPQATGVAPLPAQARDPGSERTAELVRAFVAGARRTLAGEAQANALLLRGFERYRPLPSLHQRFGLKGVCVAQYPMYRGVSRLLGMEVAEPPTSVAGAVETLVARFGRDGNDFYFLHVKGADTSGEDGNFAGKVAAIEEIDRLLPQVTALRPEVSVVTSDHSTPSLMASHSWHPVPVMIRARLARVDEVGAFDEYGCARGMLGLRPGVHLMGLALAHAGRLKKYGA